MKDTGPPLDPLDQVAWWEQHTGLLWEPDDGVAVAEVRGRVDRALALARKVTQKW